MFCFFVYPPSDTPHPIEPIVAFVGWIYAHFWSSIERVEVREPQGVALGPPYPHESIKNVSDLPAHEIVIMSRADKIRDKPTPNREE
jgi:hypothetical protein